MRESVRSGRRANFFITENKFIDHYAAKVGGSGVAVYSILQRCANSETKETWISAQRMAEVLAMDKSTVYRHLKQLEDLRLIKTLRTREKTIYVVLPVPTPRSEADSAPLFDRIDMATAGQTLRWPLVASEGTILSGENQLHHGDFEVAAQRQTVASVRTGGRSNENRNKEEQDFLNKNQEQDFLNKIEIDTIKSAKTLIKALKLSDASMSAAIAAIEEKRESKSYASDGTDEDTPFAGTVNEIATLANQARRRSAVSSEEFLDQFLAKPLAEHLLKSLGLPGTSNMISTVEAAIKAEASFSRVSIEESAARITRAAMEDSARGVTVDRFYFENAKWRSNARISKAEQRKNDNLAANARAKEILRGQFH